MIESLTFSGAKPPTDRTPNEREAINKINNWLIANPACKLISIETVSEVRSGESKFSCLKIWYEVST
jgi:hypothetical protein